MKNQNKLSEEELRRSLREEVQYDTEFFLMHDLHPEHQFSEEFLEKMMPLLQAARRGTIKAAEHIMGWQYYAKQGMAAVLICFLLACAAMPETVLAGYHKLIEVVETIYEEYTEFRYRVNEESNVDEEFKPIKLNYLPEGMEEVKKRKHKNSIYLLYVDEEEHYLNIYQKEVVENSGAVYTLDSESTTYKFVWIKNEYIQLFFESNEIRFVNLHNNYRIIGKTNLTEKELIQILEQIEY